LILKVISYLFLLAALAGIVWWLPMLWELAVAGAIGGAYWIFFRIPPDTT
jgi:predicted acyltransferase